MEQLRKLWRDPETKRKAEALRAAAAENIFKWPASSRQERWKRRIKKYIFFRNVPPIDRYSWPNALLAEGLSEGMREDGRSAGILKEYFDGWLRRGLPMYCLDNGANGMPLMDLYEYTGEKKYLDGAGKIAAFLKEHKRDGQGNLPYRVYQANHIYADALGMICPFLCRYGKRTEEEKTKELGAGLLIRFLENGMDAESGLPYHGFDSQTGEKQGCIGWGRAAGWLMTGLSGSLPWLLEEGTAGGLLRKRFQELAKAVLDYQRTDGSFAWLLPAKEGPGDTSATAMIACALLEGRRDGLLDDEAEEAVCRAASFVLSCVKDGRVGQCSGECGGFGEYPQRYGSYPWSDGPALRLLGLMEGVASERTGTVNPI